MPGGVNVDVQAGCVAILTICSEPVNTLTAALWTELTNALIRLESNPGVRGVIIASGLSRDVFSAGNDLKELYAPKTSRERYTAFWVLQNVFLARLYRSPLVTIAAIRGACPAGGCCIAMCCDHRVMTEAGHIGLNEVALGISVPEMWAKLMARTVGPARTERLLQCATLLPPADALTVGLVDELVPSAADLLPAARREMAVRLQAPDAGRQRTKAVLRGEFADAWEVFAEGEAAGAWEMLQQPATVAALEAVFKRLAGKSKPKPKL